MLVIRYCHMIYEGQESGLFGRVVMTLEFLRRLSSARWMGGSHLKAFLCQRISFQAHSHGHWQEASVYRPLQKASDFPAGFTGSDLRDEDRNCTISPSLVSEAMHPF